MERPLVSVVMINYNYEKYVKEAILSVVNQTYDNWELIVVDDGSTDGSVEAIKSIEDPRIRLFQMDKNRHICCASNYGLKQIRGTYVARLDSDDLWREDKLEKQVQFFNEHKEAKICFTKLDVIDPDGKNINDSAIEYELYNKRQKDRAAWLRFFFFEGNSLIQSGMMYEASLLEEVGAFNLAYMQSQDMDFFIRLIKRYDFYFIEEPLISYRRGHIQTSGRNYDADRRFYNEYMNIRSKFFDDMSDELLIEAFGECFRRKDSRSKEELACEKAFLLLHCIGNSEFNPVLGLNAFEQLFRDPQMTQLLEDKYAFTPKDYYAYNKNHQYFLPEVADALHRWFAVEDAYAKTLKEKDEILKELDGIKNSRSYRALLKIKKLLGK